jgi:hypothetical protein
LGQLHRLGGSHAQRDVLLQTWIYTAIRSGEHSAVEEVLTRRVKHRAEIGSLRRFIRQQREHAKARRFLRAA